MFGFIFFITNSMDNIAYILYNDLSAISIYWELLFRIPVVIVDSILYMWIFISLSRSIRQLSVRNQVAKLKLMNRFKWILIFFVFMGFLWVIYEKFDYFYQQILILF